jgi:hypothetical protein
MNKKMNQGDKIYFNQNLIFHKDILYNTGANLEISICNTTNDYKTFSPPTLHISVIGENNLRRVCSLNYPNAVDLFTSIKEVLSNIETIYSTGRNNQIVKKYHFDRSLKFEFIQIQNNGDRVVSIMVLHSSSDFAKVIVPYSVFLSFAIGILKYFINDYINISFNFSNRSLITEILDQSKQTVNLIKGIPNSLVEIQNYPPPTFSNNPQEVKPIKLSEEELKSTLSLKIEDTIEDLDKFLGKDMENINLNFDDKSIIDVKSKNLQINSLLITKTLSKNLSVLESMINAAVTRPDPMICIFEGFRRSMNLDSNFSFLPEVTQKDIKSFLHISKTIHDLCLNMYLNQNNSIPSGFAILKYNPPKEKINEINLQLAYDLLLIIGFIKVFRSRMESRDSDANKNGSIFYLRLRLFLDPLVYSFLDETKYSLILNNAKTFFEMYSEIGFFNDYQQILVDNGFQKITVNDISTFCNELNTKVFSKGMLSVNIDEKHKDLNNSNFLRIKSDNNLSIEQIINEVVPLEVFTKMKMSEEEIIKLSEPFSQEVKDLFFKKEETSKKKETESNIIKTVKFFNNEIPLKLKDEFLTYLKGIQFNEIDFTKFEMDEFGDNVIKAFYIWNESSNRKEPLTEFRTKLENCLLTKDLIITKYKTVVKNKVEDVWDLE